MSFTSKILHNFLEIWAGIQVMHQCDLITISDSRRS